MILRTKEIEDQKVDTTTDRGVEVDVPAAEKADTEAPSATELGSTSSDSVGRKPSKGEGEGETAHQDSNPASATVSPVSWNQQDGTFTIQIGNSTDKALVINDLARRAALAVNSDERKAATQILTAYLHQSSEIIKQAAEAGKMEGPEPLGNKDMSGTSFAASIGAKAIQKATREAAALKESMLKRSVTYTEPSSSDGVASVLKAAAKGSTEVGHPEATVPATDEEE